MSLSYKDLFEVHTKYIDFLVSKSYLIHQYVNNPNATGNEVEIEIRNFLNDFIPNRFKVTHGYICRALNNIDEPLVSPQLDCIIVDTLVPHSIFPLSYTTGQEVVPYESVVGIIEIKRTLNINSFSNAVAHLKQTIDILQIDKSDQTEYIMSGLRAGDLTTGIYSNPLLAILSINHEFDEFDFTGKDADKYRNICEGCDVSSIDFIGSLNGLFFCPVDTSDNSYKVCPYIKKGEVRNYAFATNKNVRTGGLISRIIGFIVAYLSMTSGKYNPMGNYFYHNSTFKL